MKWFKFYGQDFLADIKMSQLSIAERLCWITLLCLAHEQDRAGNVRYCTEELVKSKMGLQENDKEWNDLKGVFDEFIRLDMIEYTETGIYLKNYGKRQETNLTPAEKMQRVRDKKYSVTNVTPNRVDKNRIDKSIQPSAPTEPQSDQNVSSKPTDGGKPIKTGRGEIMNRLIKWAEQKSGTKIINFGREQKSISKMLIGGYSEKQIMECWENLEKDEFWNDRGINFAIVASNIDKVKTKKELSVGKFY